MLPPMDHLVELAFERVPAGCIVTDAEGKIVLLNHEIERIFGYARDELLGKSVELLVPGQSREAHVRQRGGFMEEATPTGAGSRSMGAGRDLRGVRKDGREVSVEIGLSRLETPAGALVLACVVDVTQRREVEEKLWQAEERLRESEQLRALGTLASGIAHDLNNILLGVLGHASLARREVGARHPTTDDLDAVIDAAHRGADLVKRIYAFALDHRASPPRPSHLDRPLEEAARLLRAALPSSIEIDLHVDGGTPTVMADETQIHQLLMNLGTNAAQAIGDKQGHIVVRAGVERLDAAAAASAGLRPGLYAILTVADDGPGMAPEVASRAFEAFYTTKPPGEGSGLGLSIVRGIARGLGGEAHISTQEGVGTTVTIYLPAQGSPPLQAEAAGAAGKPHILLVDDQVRLATLGKRILELSGFAVTAHCSSLQALEEFRAQPHRFDLVISDNLMPGLTGLELLRQVSMITPGVPTMLVTGRSDLADADTLPGVQRVLAKPYTPEQLCRLAGELTQSRASPSGRRDGRARGGERDMRRLD